MREADYTRMQVALDETLERLVAVSPLTPPTPNTHAQHIMTDIFIPCAAAA